MFADVHFRPEAHHEHELGELHALARAGRRRHPGAGDRRRERPLVPAAVRRADRRHREARRAADRPRRALPVRRGPAAYWDAVAGLAQQNALSDVVELVGLVDLRERVDDRLERRARRARASPGRKTSTRGLRLEPGDPRAAEQHAVAHEPDVERARRLAPAVEHDRDVAGRIGRHVADDEVGPRVRLPADAPTPRARCGSASRARRASGSARPRGSWPARAAPGRSCRTCTCANPDGAVIHSPKPCASTLRQLGSSGVSACSVNRICIFGDRR